MNDPKASDSTSQLSRRNFLTKSSTAVAGGALLGTLPVARFAHGALSPGDTIKVAMVGCGGRGSGAMLDAFAATNEIKLVAMADAFKSQIDRSLDNISKQQSKDKVTVTDDTKFVGFEGYKQAISMADVVILATPPGFRPIHFEEAIRQGKHVFMEKPVATDPAGVRRVLAAAKEAKAKNLKVGVGLQRRHQKPYIECVQRMHDGAIGDIVSMRAYWNGTTPWLKKREDLEKKAGRKLTEMEYQMQNWYYFVWLCGDHIVEQHIHNLDVINWIKNGHPVKAHGMGGCEVRKGPDYGEIFDHHAVEFEYADGSRMFSQCRHINGCWSDVSEHAVGTKGSWNSHEQTIRGENPFRSREKGKNPYQQEHEDLFAAIRNDKPYNEAESGAISSMTAIFGRMATYSGKVLEWDQALNSQISVMPQEFDWAAPVPVNPGPDGMYPRAVPGKTRVI